MTSLSQLSPLLSPHPPLEEKYEFTKDQKRRESPQGREPHPPPPPPHPASGQVTLPGGRPSLAFHCGLLPPPQPPSPRLPRAADPLLFLCAPPLPSPSSGRKPALPWRGAGSVENSLLPPLLLPDFQSSPVLLPKAVPLEEPPPELLTGHASARAGDLGLDRGLPPGLAASDLGEGGDRLGPGRSLPRGGAFTHMVRAWTPAQASRPNLTTGSVILL